MFFYQMKRGLSYEERSIAEIKIVNPSQSSYTTMRFEPTCMYLPYYACSTEKNNVSIISSISEAYASDIRH